MRRLEPAMAPWPPTRDNSSRCLSGITAASYKTVRNRIVRRARVSVPPAQDFS